MGQYAGGQPLRRLCTVELAVPLCLNEETPVKLFIIHASFPRLYLVFCSRIPDGAMIVTTLVMFVTMCDQSGVTDDVSMPLQ